jgi:excinuclease ABC subunit C
MLFQPESFAGFGPNRFDPHCDRPTLDAAAARRPDALRQLVREKAPRRPGVYGMLDPRGRLVYVGKAKDLRCRLLSYFRSGSRDAKAGKILAVARTVLWENAPCEFAALLRELELIRRFRPTYNVQGIPGRRPYTYLCLGRKPAPYFYLHREPSATALATYGPLSGSRRLGDTVRRLNDLFRLRDCPQSQPMRFADQGELFPVLEPAGCLRYEIGTCPGPCIGAVTRPHYARNVHSARAFLDGQDDETMPRLRAEMAAASAALQFEKAAAMRDRIDDLFWLQERLAWLQSARREHSFVYPVTTQSGRGVWYLIRGGRVLHAVAEPTNPRSRRRVAAAIDAVFPPHGGPSVVPDDLYDHVLLVTGWFRRRPDERSRILTVAQARAWGTVPVLAAG